MRQAIVVAVAVLLVLAVGASARAAECEAPHAVGYRVLPMPSGRKLAVWYPASGTEQPITYLRGGIAGSVARDALPSSCPRVPLLLFSHGLGGCALQSTAITEGLARRGYVVAAPDHADAGTCGIDGEPLRMQNIRTEQPLADPARWNEQSELGRRDDLRAAIERVRDDPALERIADTTRIGAIGHSLGGYSVLGLGGAWPTWRTTEVKAVVALSPYVAPFLMQGSLSKLAVPVMYQGAQFDWPVTPNLEGAKGAYATSPAPKYYVRLRGGTHVEWTNLACLGTASIAGCFDARPNVVLIERYVAAFLDRYLKDRPAPLLASEGRGLEAYRSEER